MKIICLLLFIWFGRANMFAQTISLKQYRERVLHYNQDLQKSKEAISAAWHTLRSIRSDFFPTLDVSGNYSYQLERVEIFSGTDLKHDNYGLEADLLQNLYSGNGIRKQYELAQLQYDMRLLSNDRTIENIRYAADVAYWTAVANCGLLDLAKEYVRLITELYQVIYSRFTEGAISKTDVLMIQNRLKEAELQKKNAFLNYKIALQTMNILMGEEPETVVVLSDSMHQSVDLPPWNELDRVLLQRSDYQVAAMSVVSAKIQTDLIRSNFLPRVFIGIKERYGTTMMNIDGKSAWTTTCYAQIDIPIFRWGKMRQEIKKNQAQEKILLLEKSLFRDEINQELTHAWTNVTETAQKLKIVYSSLEIAKDNLLLNTLSYNEGKLPVLDVLSAQVTWLQAYSNVVTINYQYRLALAKYAKVCGGENRE